MPDRHEEQLQNIKAKYPKAYEPWSAADDELLKTSCVGGMSIDTLAKTLQRQPSAIRSRLKKIGMSILNLDSIPNQDASRHASSENALNEAEATTSNVISRSLAPLMEKNSMVYTLLISKIRSGFFERPQPKTVIHALADNIIDAISSTGGEDAC